MNKLEKKWDLLKIKLTLDRFDRPPRVFFEGLLADNAIGIRTFSPIPDDQGLNWSREWQTVGAIEPGHTIASVRKYLFYHEYFGVMEVRGLNDELLGYYTDICTPLIKTGDEYSYTDLFLDIYSWPDGRYKILDEDEFDEAVRKLLISPEMEFTARAAVERLVREIEAGQFPFLYVQP